MEDRKATVSDVDALIALLDGRTRAGDSRIRVEVVDVAEEEDRRLHASITMAAATSEAHGPAGRRLTYWNSVIVCAVGRGKIFLNFWKDNGILAIVLKKFS